MWCEDASVLRMYSMYAVPELCMEGRKKHIAPPRRKETERPKMMSALRKTAIRI